MVAGILDLQHRTLAHFGVLAETRELTVAASRLRITPRALLRSVRDLEEALGQPLLASRSRTVRLTPAGERLTRSSAHVLNALDRFAAAVRYEGRALRVAHVPGSDTLSMLLDEAASLSPAIDLIETAGEDAEQIEDVLAGRLDAAVCAYDGALPPELTWVALPTDPLVVVMSETAAPSRGTVDLVAPRYGRHRPVHDRLIAELELDARFRLHWVDILAPVRCDLEMLVRASRGRPVVLASSTTGLRQRPGQEVVVLSPRLQWRLVWPSASGDGPVAVLRAAAARILKRGHMAGASASATVRVASDPRTGRGGCP